MVYTGSAPLGGGRVDIHSVSRIKAGRCICMTSPDARLTPAFPVRFDGGDDDDDDDDERMNRGPDTEPRDDRPPSTVHRPPSTAIATWPLEGPTPTWAGRTTAWESIRSVSHAHAQSGLVLHNNVLGGGANDRRRRDRYISRAVSTTVPSFSRLH